MFIPTLSVLSQTQVKVMCILVVRASPAKHPVRASSVSQNRGPNIKATVEVRGTPLAQPPVESLTPSQSPTTPKPGSSIGPITASHSHPSNSCQLHAFHIGSMLGQCLGYCVGLLSPPTLQEAQNVTSVHISLSLDIPLRVISAVSLPSASTTPRPKIFQLTRLWTQLSPIQPHHEFLALCLAVIPLFSLSCRKEPASFLFSPFSPSS